MKLIVGLGNPGAKYRGTRHNVGFAALDELARRHRVEFESAPAEAMMARVRDFAEPVLLAKPLTFMNLSGHPVGDLLRYFRIELAGLFVLVDDANLPLARLRARARGSEGGHNGLKSIVAQLGTQEFARLRIGVDAEGYTRPIPGVPNVDVCLVLDPMLATGGSASATVDMLKQWGARKIKYMGLLAAPEGIAKLTGDHPDVPIFVAAIDDHLNDIGYIVPGLGDAGDRQFGTG